MKSRIMYTESKAEGLCGPACIGRVFFNKSGKTLIYRNRKFQSLRGQGFKSNYRDIEAFREFWISGPRKDGQDRLYGERIPIRVDEDVWEEYWTQIRGLSLAPPTTTGKHAINGLLYLLSR
jgi:hypothetical protein